MSRCQILGRLLVTGCMSCSMSVQIAAAVEFNRDIRPILSDHCFACHGPDASKRKADLRLDGREAAVEAGAISAEDPAESDLLTRIGSTDPKTQMPPPEFGKPLNESQIELLKTWIQEGAEYQPHWSFAFLKRPEVPHPANIAWVRNPIDAFVLADLESRKLVPSPAASPQRLRRRMTLDLTGIPPTWDDVVNFSQDFKVDSVGAIDTLLEQLLSSPQHGERMAVGWLDLVRYADTVGFHGDQNQNVFPYRDYVIDAFRSNKRFDQFTREQLAGDLIPGASAEQRTASGFNRLNMMTREGGAQPREYLAKYQADRVRTVGMTWLGLTTGCAECHDHKYDPFTSRDFYQMGAFFADLRQWGVYADYGYTPNADLRGFDNDYPFPPELEVQSPALVRRQQVYRTQLNDLARQWLNSSPSRSTALRNWLGEVQAWQAQHPTGWMDVEPTSPTDGKWTRQIVASSLPVACIRLSVPDGDKAFENASLQLEFTRIAVDGTTHEVPIRRADANHQRFRYQGGRAILDIRDRWQLPSSPSINEAVAVWQLQQPLKLDTGERLQITMTGLPADTLGLSLAWGPVPRLRPFDFEAVEAIACCDPRAAIQDDILLSYSLVACDDAVVRDRLHERERGYRDCRDGWTWTQISESGPPLTTRILPRGNWFDETGDLVEPHVPAFLPGIKDAAGRRLTRLDLANWLVSRDNPLTARVVVNRLWAQFFGSGLSATLDDLGAQGEWPSHPELLDWLASEFIESGWDVRHILRLIVTSNVYQQDSRLRPEIRENDPGDRWLAWHPPRRLEAEAVRDNALSIAGLLNLDSGGPSIKPYQPAGYYANIQFPDRDYQDDKDDRRYRRGIYMHWQRTFLHPMLASFDAPSREDCIALRNKSNTPQQALVLLNDPTFCEAALGFAQRTIRTSRNDDDRLRDAFRRATLRDPDAMELQRLWKYLQSQRSWYSRNVDEAKKLLAIEVVPSRGLGARDSSNRPVDIVELAAWFTVCRVILNLHETMTRY